MESTHPDRIQDEIQRFAQVLSIGDWSMAPVKQPVLRKRNYDSCHIARLGAGSMEIEFSILNAFLQEAGQDSFGVEDAFLHKRAAKFEVGLEQLMATCRAMDNIGGRTVLRQDHCLDSLSGGSLNCGSLLC
jgi:hypothetical protein